MTVHLLGSEKPWCVSASRFLLFRWAYLVSQLSSDSWLQGLYILTCRKKPTTPPWCQPSTGNMDTDAVLSERLQVQCCQDRDGLMPRPSPRKHWSLSSCICGAGLAALCSISYHQEHTGHWLVFVTPEVEYVYSEVLITAFVSQVLMDAPSQTGCLSAWSSDSVLQARNPWPACIFLFLIPNQSLAPNSERRHVYRHFCVSSMICYRL